MTTTPDPMPSNGSDSAEAYLLLRSRLSAALTGRPAEDADRPVPCCPQWSVQQTVAHLAGVCADVLAGRVQDAGSPAWTAAQVEAGRGRSVGELLADWADTGPRVAALLAAAPKVMGQITMDALSHEYDLRDALGLPPPAADPEGDPALPAAVDWVAPRFVRAAEKAGFPPFRLAVGDRAWQYREGEPQVTATWSDLETLRALTGRLSLAELRALPWSADPGPWLPAFTWAAFAPATR